MSLREFIQRRVLVLVFIMIAIPASAQEPTGSVAGDVVARPAKFRGGVVVHLDKVAGSFRPPARPVAIDQKGMRFIPHVVAVLRGGSVMFTNSDAVRHNVFTPDGDKYNLGTWGQGETKSHTFQTVGVFQQLCNVHPEMLGYVVVLDNPYFAVSGDDGKFEIKNVPPGTYTLKTWSEKLPETTRQVTVTAGAAAAVHVELGK